VRERVGEGAAVSRGEREGRLHYDGEAAARSVGEESEERRVRT
jgi:hypothetical protein